MVYIRWILYADDLVMFSKSIVEVKTIMNIPNDTCSRFGLSITISFPRTKTQVFKNEELANLASLFSIGENVVENVSEFTYLGQTFSNKEQGSRTDLRVSKAIGKFNEMRQVLTDKKVNMTTRAIECFHMTSRRPYWCPKTMKRRPCWCPKPVLWELNSFLMQTLSFVSINLHRCRPRE